MGMKGYKGAVNSVTNVLKWEVEWESTTNNGANSGTDNMANELDGVLDWRGYYIAHGHTPGTNPGAELAFKGTIDQAVDTDMTVEGTAMVERWRVDWDYANNKPITHTVWFAANNTALTPGDTAIATTAPSWFMSNDAIGAEAAGYGKVMIGTAIASPVYTELCGVKVASLSCWSEIEPYANSCTDNNTARAAGNINWMVDLAVDIDQTDTIEVLDDKKAVKIYVEGATNTFWEAKWVVWKRVGPLVVDVAGRELVTIQYRGMGRGWHDEATAGTFVQGALTAPSTTPVWS